MHQCFHGSRTASVAWWCPWPWLRNQGIGGTYHIYYSMSIYIYTFIYLFSLNFRPLQRDITQKIWPYMVQYLNFRILEISHWYNRWFSGEIVAIYEQMNICRDLGINWCNHRYVWEILERSPFPLGKIYDIQKLYPLVICYITTWVQSPCLLGKLTISMTIFHSYASHY